MGEGAETMIFMGVILKIPVAALLYIVWRAIKDEPAPEQAPPPSGGDHEPHRFRRSPTPPRSPRRGPGHGPAPGSGALRRSGRPRRGAEAIAPRAAAPARLRTS